MTTDMDNQCSTSHSGTSASAPIAAGILALMLQANPSLTWRDVQHITIQSSDSAILLKNSGWISNGIGLLYSNKFGFGLMNADNMVENAKTWNSVGRQLSCLYGKTESVELKGATQEFTMNIGNCSAARGTQNYMEHVVIYVFISDYSRLGDLELELTSPMGTRTVLFKRRHLDTSRGSIGAILMSRSASDTRNLPFLCRYTSRTLGLPS